MAECTCDGEHLNGKGQERVAQELWDFSLCSPPSPNREDRFFNRSAYVCPFAGSSAGIAGWRTTLVPSKPCLRAALSTSFRRERTAVKSAGSISTTVNSNVSPA